MDITLTWKTIGNLTDGQAGHAIDAAIARAVADLDDRGDDGKPRVVTVNLILQKQRGIPSAEVTAKASLPTYRTERTACRVMQRQSRRGPEAVLNFQDLAPDNAEQDTIDKHIQDD